jgi:Helix-turn-helix domain
MTQKLNIDEAARLSGMSVSWWRQKVFRKQVPYYRVGRRIVFDSEDIAKVIGRCRVEPQGGLAKP